LQFPVVVDNRGSVRTVSQFHAEINRCWFAYPLAHLTRRKVSHKLSGKDRQASSSENLSNPRGSQRRLAHQGRRSLEIRINPLPKIVSGGGAKYGAGSPVSRRIAAPQRGSHRGRGPTLRESANESWHLRRENP